MVPSIEQALTEYREAKENLKDIVRSAQRRCKHKQLAECDYLRFEIGGGALPPIRICLSCGMTEEGWGSGYLVLGRGKISVQPIPRDQLYSLRLGLMLQDEHRGPLLRNETTIKKLINEAG